MKSQTETTTSGDNLMLEATMVTHNIQGVVDDGLFPFQAVRLFIYEALKLRDERSVIQMGCICPPGANKECGAQLCPRKPVRIG